MALVTFSNPDYKDKTVYAARRKGFIPAEYLPVRRVWTTLFALDPRIESISLLTAGEPNIGLKSRVTGAYLGLAVAEASRCQSQVTHHNRLADLGTLTVIRMVQAALLNGGRGELKRLADDLAAARPQYRHDTRRMENPSGYIVDTLRAVFQALFAADGFEAALVDVINRGGDSDTTGAILGMIAGALYGVGGIPQRWLSALDREASTACLEQAEALLRLSPFCRNCA